MYFLFIITKVFSGNIDPDSVSLITFNETLEVRWLRLFVVTVTSKAALRMELYGQPKGKVLSNVLI